MLPWMREKLFGGRHKLIGLLSRRGGVCSASTSGSVPRDPLQQQLASGTSSRMFVSDSSNLFSELIRLSIISVEGGVWAVDAAPDFTVEKLKSMALCRFYNPNESIKMQDKYKLILISEKRTLENENTLNQEFLKDNDEILLVIKRTQMEKDVCHHLTEECCRGPTEEEIKAATMGLEERNTLKIRPIVECTADFQSEIRKILISLVEASARILTPSPNANEVFEIIKDRLENKSKAQTEAKNIKQLTDMGFQETAAREALKKNRNNATAALNYLLEHGCKPSEDEDNLSIQEEENASSKLDDTKRPKPAETVTQSVQALLESFREYKRQEFKANSKALHNLIEMGFEEEDIRDALRITGNNQASACEWLLGDRRPSLEDLDTGLDPEGPIYKAIMSNPAIQLSLTNPKMLLAFLSMLETPSSANMWINDPDASPVLSQIFKTYHAEKHALQMNRFVEQQQQQQQQQQQRNVSTSTGSSETSSPFSYLGGNGGGSQSMV